MTYSFKLLTNQVLASPLSPVDAEIARLRAICGASGVYIDGPNFGPYTLTALFLLCSSQLYMAWSDAGHTMIHLRPVGTGTTPATE